jgi:hypothetical protein
VTVTEQERTEAEAAAYARGVADGWHGCLSALFDGKWFNSDIVDELIERCASGVAR